MNLKKAFQYQKQIGKLMTDIVGDDLEIIKTPVNTKTTAAANPNKFLVNKEVYKRSELNYLFPTEQQIYKDEVKVLKSYNTKGYALPKLIAVYNYLADCRRLLAEAIAKTKLSLKIGANAYSYDAAVIYANDLRKTLTLYDCIANMGETEKDEVQKLAFSRNNEKLIAEYTVTNVKTPILEAVQAAKTEYDRLLELTSELSDAIEAAALTSRIDNKAVPAFPVTADLDYIYTHLEKLQNK